MGIIDTEEKFRRDIIARIEQDFYCHLEHPGKDISGSRRYLDAFIVAKPHMNFRKPNMVFGIEFKAPDDHPSWQRMTRLMNQAIIYSNTNWKNYGTIPIFMCELKLHSPNHCIEEVNKVFVRLMGSFNIGSIQVRHDKIVFSMSDTVVYDTLDGVSHKGTQWKGEPKL